MLNTEQLPYQTDKSSHRNCSIKKAVLKNFAISIEKHLIWSLFFIKLQTFRSATLIKKRLQHRCFPAVKVLQNTYFEGHLSLKCLTVIVSGQSFQNHPDSVILQKYQALSNQSFKHNLEHMPSLYLTHMLPF